MVATDVAPSYSEAEMPNVFKSVREWHRPRQQHSFLDRWWRNLLILLPVWPLMHVFFSGPWYEGIGSTVGYSFLYALAEYGYFHVYGGTDAEYPDPPRRSFRMFL